ncbi:MAG TPA: DUF5615 family PIN-like protein [Candidatus Binatus sp.]|nr:DUF5615 family PIN-like protein [Candidatus Binatus sp.]
MKIKLDENLPLRLAVALRELGHEVHTLFDERLVGQSDKDIWEATQKESRFLVTQDLDFSDLRKLHHGHTREFCWCGYARQAAETWWSGSRNYFRTKIQMVGLVVS